MEEAGRLPHHIARSAKQNPSAPSTISTGKQAKSVHVVPLSTVTGRPLPADAVNANAIKQNRLAKRIHNARAGMQAREADRVRDARAAYNAKLRTESPELARNPSSPATDKGTGRKLFVDAFTKTTFKQSFQRSNNTGRGYAS